MSVDLTIVGLRDAAVFVPKRYWMSKNRLLNCNLSIFEGRLKRLVRSKRPYNITSLWRLLQRTNMRLKNGLIASHHNFYQIHMGHLFRSKTPRVSSFRFWKAPFSNGLTCWKPLAGCSTMKSPQKLPKTAGMKMKKNSIQIYITKIRFWQNYFFDKSSTKEHRYC